MAQFTIYRSNGLHGVVNADAPVLTGEVGSLTNLLKKCLVDGYGSGPTLMSAAGWSIPSLGATNPGTNKTVFRTGAGSQFYLRVDDNAPATAKEARVMGFETMSDVDTGTGKFPSIAQAITGYTVARKSTTANSTAREWIVIADSRTAYIFTKPGDTSNDRYASFSFGDIYSLMTGDAYRCLLTGREVEDNPDTGSNHLATLVHNTPLGSSSAQAGNYMPRGYTGVGGSVAVGKHSDASKLNFFSNVAYFGSASIGPFPNPADGAAILARVWVYDPTTAPARHLRGRLRGLWCPCHAPSTFADGDVIEGGGELAGKTFLMLRDVWTQAGVAGCVAVETSDTLETN